MVTIQTYTPKSANHLVKSFWFLEVNGSNNTYEEEIIPDGHHEIIFHLTTHQAKRKSENTDWVREPNAFIAGQTLKSYRLQLLPGSKLFGIRFYPHTLFTLLGIPAVDLTDKICALKDITDDQCFWNCITNDPQGTFLNFERLLLKKTSLADFHSNSFAYINASVSEIIKQKGSITIDQLIKKTGISVKHLDTLFKRYVGITPKAVSRILKFNHFISYKINNPDKNFTTCCYETGYYDQSHLIKSFYTFTNKSPKAYFDDDSYISDVFTNL